MTCSGKELTKDIFYLQDSKFNPEDLYEYAMNLGSHIGFEYEFIIDNEAGHVIWPDTSCFKNNNEDDPDWEFIWDIGNSSIDDIRIERKLTNMFLVDANNFK